MSGLEQLALPVKKLAAGMDPNSLLSNGMTLRRTIGKSSVASEFDSLQVLRVAGIEQALAAAGPSGLLVRLGAHQTSETGIRFALGPEGKQVLRNVLFAWPRTALVALMLGLAGNAAALRLIQSLLHETRPGVLTAIVTFLAVAMAACAVPARRASRLELIQMLRRDWEEEESRAIFRSTEDADQHAVRP